MNPLTLVPDALSVTMPPPVDKATSLTGQQESTLVAWKEGPAQAGVWECDPGEFTTVRDGFHEVCQILTGTGTLITEDGEKTELGPGSTIVIPDGWRGTWRIEQTMRKTFVMISTTIA